MEPCEDGMLTAPSVVVSGVTSGVVCDDDDAHGMMMLRDDRMTDDGVGGTRAMPVMVASTGVMDDNVLSRNASVTAEPSVVNREYPGKNTSKNLSY